LDNGSFNQDLLFNAIEISGFDSKESMQSFSLGPISEPPVQTKNNFPTMTSRLVQTNNLQKFDLDVIEEEKRLNDDKSHSTT
jgi:hypothetical protein